MQRTIRTVSKPLRFTSPRYLGSQLPARTFASSSRCFEGGKGQQERTAEKPKAKDTPLSSCQEDTVLNGVNYLKNQEPVRAKPDSEYPAWLWTILKPKEYPEDGPGGKAEKVRLRAANRQRIKEQNFLKTQ